MKYEQDPPFSIQVELTEGCNRGCGFCGLRGMRKTGKEPFYFMTKETVTRIVDEIVRVGWKSRIIFSMHGEPSLNKNWLNIIRMFRKHLPSAVLSVMTNGYGIVNSDADMDTVLSKISKSGLNDLIIDMYTPNDDGHQIKDFCENKNIKYQILDKGVPLYSSSHTSFRILFNPPIQTDEGAAINRHLCNHCGAAAPLDFSYDGKRCARPFREMTFRYDGSVALCCNDFRGQYPIGNINERDIDDIWQDKRFKAARILLYQGERSAFVPCKGCNALSHRVGLLPDLKGQQKMPEATDKIREFAKSVAEETEPLCGKDWNTRKWEEK